nr:unnamed protein product [Mus musculus]
MFLLCLTGNTLREEEGLGSHASDICIGSELNATKTDNSLPSPSSLWSASHPASSKKMDGYILSLVQKKTHPVRTNKPRTSVNADPTKGLLRNGSVCVRAPSGVPPGSSVNFKNTKQMCLPAGGITSLENGPFSPPKQRSKDSKTDQLESKRLALPESCSAGAAMEPQSKHVPKAAKAASQELTRCQAGLGESMKESNQASAVSPKTSPGRGPVAPAESKALQLPKKMSQKNSLQAVPALDRPALDFKSEGSSQSLEEGHLVKAQFIPGQQAAARPHRAHRNPGVARSATLKARGQAAMEHGLPTVREKPRAAGKKCRFPDDSDTNKKFRKTSAKGRRSGGLQDAGLPGRALGTGGHRAGSRAHAHGREPVVAKPKHKRTDYRRWKSSAEVSYEEAPAEGPRRGSQGARGCLPGGGRPALRQPLCLRAQRLRVLGGVRVALPLHGGGHQRGRAEQLHHQLLRRQRVQRERRRLRGREHHHQRLRGERGFNLVPVCPDSPDSNGHGPRPPHPSHKNLCQNQGFAQPQEEDPPFPLWLFETDDYRLSS